jgi:hypothetical protein
MTGLFEGAVLSPRGFAAHTGSLIQKLRESGLGITIDGEWCGAPMFMDDILLIPKDESEVEAMLELVLDWCYEHRMTVAQSKTHVALVNSHFAAPDFIKTRTWTWLPPARLEPDAERRRRGAIPLAFETQTGNVKYLGYVLGDKPRHVAQQLALTKSAAERVENTAAAREGLTLSQAMWAWTIYGRHHAEWPAAIWPQLSPGCEAAFEYYQVRALLGLLGRAVPRGWRRGKGSYVQPSRAVTVATFGVWELRERRLLHRVRYSGAHTLSGSRPWRAHIGAYFSRLADAPPQDGFDRAAFAATSPTAALAMARKIVAEHQSTQAVDEGPTGTDDESERDDDDLDECTGQVEADDDAPMTDDNDNDDPLLCPFHVARDALGRSARKAVAAIADSNRAATLDLAQSSADLFKALAPSRAWLKDVAWDQELDQPLAAFVALIIGVWWAALAVRQPGTFAKGRCGACGRTVPNLPVHLIGGWSEGAACLKAATVREEFTRRVIDLFIEYGCLPKLTATPRGSTERLAMMLGNGGNGLPRGLSRGLPQVFCDTFGRWSAARAPAHTSSEPAAEPA